MLVCPLFSGSSGNATLVVSGSTRILVDCGVSCAAVARELAAFDVALESLSAILVTHAHDDHVRGLNVLAKRVDAPIYASVGTWETMMNRGKAVGIAPKNVRVFQSNRGAKQPLDLGDLQASFFSTPHDAQDSVGYVVEDGRVSFGFATDLGRATPGVRRALCGCDVVLLEANYDEDMLVNGPYPYVLQERIRGPYGHLCNDESGDFAVELVRSGVKEIYLGHLSQHNNTPSLARRAVETALRSAQINPQSDCVVRMTRREGASEPRDF